MRFSTEPIRDLLVSVNYSYYNYLVMSQLIFAQAVAWRQRTSVHSNPHDCATEAHTDRLALPRPLAFRSVLV